MRRPNILLIVTDDQRHDTLGSCGQASIQTPHMDALAARGSTWTRCHIMGGTVPAVCCPSRAMLHSGRQLFSIHDHGRSIPDAHTTIGEFLKRAGYRRYGLGKWHNGPKAFARSFDAGRCIFFGGMADHWQMPQVDFDPSGRYDSAPTIIENQHSTDLIADAAAELLRGHDGAQPFFMNVNFLAPHDPRTMPERFLEKYRQTPPELPQNFMPEHPFENGELRVRDELLASWPRDGEDIRRQLGEYYAMIEHLDEALGRILQALEDGPGLAETLIVFTGDNGLALGQHGLMGKQSCYDHSLRVPLIAAGPGVPAGVRCEQLCYVHDIFPTMCDVLETAPPDSVTSRSLLPLLQSPGSGRQVLYAGYRAYMRSLSRDDGWKLIVTTPLADDGGQPPRWLHQPASQACRLQMFDLNTDPTELQDRSQDPEAAALLQELCRSLEAERRSCSDPWQGAEAFHDVCRQRGLSLT